ncbi:general odorant-binding protein 56d-like [Lucilia sericata]|uniref:general odorant-binding protein 56d-like n=1 Tax=Lucilia sericata TaxID=13632 RepID=UPI0018A7FF71|nr:general odorant-binding protein 56d-like [Lucilia sericata]
MKIFISLAIVCLIASASADFIEAETFCKKQENLLGEEFEKFKYGWDEANFSLTPVMINFIACFYEKVGFIKNNTIQEDSILLQTDNNVRSRKIFVDNCKHVVGKDRLETASYLFKCFQKIKLSSE